jgi:hypothetical protein
MQSPGRRRRQARDGHSREYTSRARWFLSSLRRRAAAGGGIVRGDAVDD